MVAQNKTVWIGGVVMALLAVGGGLTQLGVLPWATASDLKELKADYKHMINLKNQDNEWYRELNVKVGKIETNVDNIKDDVREIKEALRSR